MPTGKKTLRKARGRPPLSQEQVGDMRARIAEAARRLFREEGYEAVSMRRLASEIGCTPMSIYSYYDSKIDVLRLVWSDVFAEVFAHVARAKAKGRDANAVLHAKCRAYVQYWLDHPEAYRMVFMSAGVTQSEVSVFVDESTTAADYRVFATSLAAAAHRAEGDVAEHAQALICGLNGIAHTLITISGFAWAPANTLVAVLVEGAATTARAV